MTSATKSPTMTPDRAMQRANDYARRRYRDSMVSIASYDSLKFRAFKRCANARDPQVRARANRIAEFGRSYRYCRWVLAASAAELSAFAKHPCIGE